MSYPGEEPDLEAVCEFLGLTDDPESHATYATEAHRCYRLPNPTRIASTHQETYCLGANHQNCPIYLGEGVAQTTPTATPPPPRPGARGAQEEGTVSGPPRQQRAAGGRQQRPQPGTLGPRPRPGGISMPAATVGLLALAVAIVGLAFLIQQLLGGDGDETLAAADQEATQTAEAIAADGDETPDEPNGDEDPVNGEDDPTPPPDDEETPPPDEEPTPDETDGNGGNGGQETYTVQSGDFCSSIAEQFGTTVDAIIEANPDVGNECTIFEGQELTIPQ